MVRSTPRLTEEIVRSTEAIIYTLKQLYDRKEKKTFTQSQTRNGIKSKLNKKDDDGDIEFEQICDCVEALRLSIPSNYFELFDEVHQRILKYYHVKESPLVSSNIIVLNKIRANIKLFFRNSFYYMLKVQQNKEELRDEKYENAALGISEDAASIYNEGIGQEVRNKPHSALPGGTGDEDEEESEKEEEDYL